MNSFITLKTIDVLREDKKLNSKTNEEINKLALDLFHGKIFTDKHCHSGEEVGNVFTILTLAGPEMIEGLDIDDIGMIYEYIDKAMPMACNGNPMFLSCGFLSKTDTLKVMVKYRELHKVTDETLSKEN